MVEKTLLLFIDGGGWIALIPVRGHFVVDMDWLMRMQALVVIDYDYI